MTVTWLRASLLDEDCDRRLATKQWRKAIIGACKDHQERDAECAACGKRGSDQDVFQLRQLPNVIGAAVGRYSHKVFKKQIEFKRDMGQHPAVMLGVTEAKGELFDECDKGIEYPPHGSTRNRAEAAVQLEGIVKEFNQAYLPYVKSSQHVEEELSIWWNADKKLFLTATPDNPTIDGCIDDFKTGIRKPIQPMQAGAQAIVLQEWGYSPRKARTVWIPRNTQTLEIFEYSLKVVQEEAKHRIEKLQKNFESFQKHRDPMVFTPRPQSFTCKKDYCSAWGTPFCPLIGGNNE